MMLVVVAYDVSTETRGRAAAAAAGGEALRGRWAAGAEVGVRVPGGCGAVGGVAGAASWRRLRQQRTVCGSISLGTTGIGEWSTWGRRSRMIRRGRW